MAAQESGSQKLSNQSQIEVKSNRFRISKEDCAKGGRTGKGKTRSARSNNPLAGIKLRTAEGRRVKDLFTTFMAKLQPGNPHHQSAALEAAELVIASEDARRRFLAGNASAEESAVRLANTARRAIEDLDKLAAPPTKGTLQDILARKRKQRDQQ